MSKIADWKCPNLVRFVGLCFVCSGGTVRSPLFGYSNVVIQCALQCSKPLVFMFGGVFNVGMSREINFMSG